MVNFLVTVTSEGLMVQLVVPQSPIIYLPLQTATELKYGCSSMFLSYANSDLILHCPLSEIFPGENLDLVKEVDHRQM